MSRTRRNFSPQFKSDLVIEVLKGESDINTIATRNSIQPNLLRIWKREFHGHLYLTAVIDWYSRCIVRWELDNTLDTRACIAACRKAFQIAKPQVLNSDQGSQFTSEEYKRFLKENGVRQSMDGKSRWADNIMIERWFRSFKHEETYLTEWNNIREARDAIRRYIYTYNFERRHSAIGYIPPAMAYYPAMLHDVAKESAA